MIANPTRLAFPATLLAGASLLLLGALGLGTGGAPASAQPGPPPGTFCLNPYSFPANGFDYPQSRRTVESWVVARDEMRAREHGWYLFAGVNSEVGGKPIWRTWCTATQAFPPAAASAASPGHRVSLNERRQSHGLTTRLTPASAPPAPSPGQVGEDSIAFTDGPVYSVPAKVLANKAYRKCFAKGSLPTSPALNNGPTLFNEGNVMITGVIYNKPASDWIKTRNLYQASALNAYLAKGDPVMPEMPDSSFVLKPMWWPVQQGDAYTALPLWDDLPPSADEDRYAGFERQELWRRAVAITVDPKPGVRLHEAKYLYGVEDSAGNRLKPRVYRGAGVVGVDQFYNWKPDLAAMDPCDRALLDQSAWWAYNREFRQGDYLVLMAMHVMSREQPAWTFQSFWWHDKPDYGPYASGRPDIPAARAPGPWRHYLMASTYGMRDRPGGGSWPIAYNPYIELAADHPIRTNCMNCHHRAAWAKASYEAPGGPDALQAFDYGNAIFDKVMRTDSMWTVASVQPNPPPPASRR
ncbi:MAG TPA: hypothetical protein VF605_08845 [Allosphingosinicella sp.]|jgi:hypothetical protein